MIEIGRLKKLKDAGGEFAYARHAKRRFSNDSASKTTGPFPPKLSGQSTGKSCRRRYPWRGLKRLPTSDRATFTIWPACKSSGRPPSIFPSTALRTSSAEVERGANFAWCHREHDRRRGESPLDMFVDSNLLIYGEVLRKSRII